MSKIDKKTLEVLDLIIEDCATDVSDFDGREFSGKTLGELHGILEAKIKALAKIVKRLAEDNLTQAKGGE